MSWLNTIQNVTIGIFGKILVGVANLQYDGEQGWVKLELLAVMVVVIVHIETKDKIRIISICEKDKNEQFLFFRNL